MKRITRKMIKIGLLTASIATLLSMAPATSRPMRDDPSADQNNPCSSLPRVCHYTWDPMSRCCIADPKYDCTDVCFGPIIH